MDSRQPLHQSSGDHPSSDKKQSFVRSDSSERRQMMDHYAKQGQQHFSQKQETTTSVGNQQYQMPPNGYMQTQQPQQMMYPQQQQQYMQYNPQQYQQQQQMMMQQHQQYQYQYQMMMMQQYQQQQQQMSGQSFYPPPSQQQKSDDAGPSTTQKQWPSVASYQVPQLNSPNQTFPQSSGKELSFQIANGEEADSIFEQAALGQKYDDQESFSEEEDGYGEEEDNNEDYEENDEGEGEEAMTIDHTLRPQKLPLETIMEENSVLHIQNKQQQVVEKKITEKKIIKKKVTIQEKPIVAPKATETKPPKMKHKYPEMSENERKLAEADAYLRKLNQKQTKTTTHQDNNDNHELSQLSSWTGESLLNIKSGGVPDLTSKHPSQMYKATLPDKERLLEDILVLRQTKNVNDEQIRLLKVSCARLRKHCDKLQDQIYTQQFESQPDWVKYKEPQQHLLQVNDLEGAMEEIRRLKRENNELVEQRQFYKVNSDKYQNRAIYMRKKFTQVKQSTSQSKNSSDSQLRLQNSQLKTSVKTKLSEVDQLKREIGEIKSKSSSFQQSSVKYRLELTQSNESQAKLMQKLLKLETDKKKLAKLEELKRHIENTMRQDDAQRDQDKEVMLQQAREAKNRSDEIDKLEEFGEFLTPNDSEEEELILHQSDVSEGDKADTGSAQDQDLVIQTKDYVAATLNAWNNCPGIVKKQLDKQAFEIDELSAQVRELNLKLTQRRTDFERIHQTQLKQDLMKHKEKIEAIYKEKLDEEKRKLLKGQVNEVDRLIKENKRLNQQIQSKW